MTKYEKKVRKIMLQYGCYFQRRGKGDHDIWYSLITNISIITSQQFRLNRYSVLKNTKKGSDYYATIRCFTSNLKRKIYWNIF